MNGTIVTPTPHIPRDRYDRPLVVPPSGKGRVPYTRATTFVGAIDDLYNIHRWEKRMVALGLASRPDLLLSVSAHRDDKDVLNRICDDAKEAAKGSAAATTGTALHALTELIDRGQELPPGLPANVTASLEAYVDATKDLKATHIEQFCVLDPLKIGGTPDRVVRYKGDTYIADLKGLALTTPLPTPTGWTTMGAVNVGDQVFGSSGQVCNVVAKSETKRIGTYIVTFNDGSEIVCDTEHIWWTISGQRGNTPPMARPIQEIISTLRTKSGQAQHRVPVARILDLPDADLPLDPYLLGVWLGDGHTNRNVITKADDLFEIIASDGHKLGKVQTDARNGVISRSVVGMTAQLKAAGVLGHKHIPGIYLRASATQRLRLLHGLMDTDGTWNTPRRRAVFNSTNKELALNVEELLATLGQRPHLATFDAHGYGKDVTAYAVEFTPVDITPFRLPRKAAKVDTTGKSFAQGRRRVILSVEPGPDVETACIAVDSRNHTYLCGERMIPTHNTGSIEWGALKIAAQLAVYSRSSTYDIATGERGIHGASTTSGIVIHLPTVEDPADARCDLLWVDLLAGWEAVKVCNSIRGARQIKFADLMTPLGPTLTEALEASVAMIPLPKRIAMCKTPDEVRALWTPEWNDHMIQAAKAKVAELEKAS